MLFASEEWFAAWVELVNADQRFRVAGAGWQGSVGLVVRDGPGQPAVHARLEGAEGEWTSLTVGADSTISDGTTFTISADRPVWRALVRQEIDPLRALFTGKARIRGQLSTILSRVSALKIMTALAGELDTTFPESS